MPNSISNVNSNMNTMDLQNNYNSSNFVSNPSLNDSQLFLKMLSVSMSNQDPLNPTDGNEFLNQMTQYATIETLSSVKNSVNTLATLQISMNMNMLMNNATDTVGREVTVLIPKGTDGSEEDSRVTGVVEKVLVNEEGIFMLIDGEKYEYSYLESINS